MIKMIGCVQCMVTLRSGREVAKCYLRKRRLCRAVYGSSGYLPSFFVPESKYAEMFQNGLVRILYASYSMEILHGSRL
jgi:hypothetical protein